MASLQQASKKAQHQAKVDMLSTLGTSQDEFETGGFLTAAAEDAVGDFIIRVKDRIQSQDLIVTGGIEDIKIEVTDTNQINIVGNPWLLYQDRGVRGSESDALAPMSPHAYTNLRPPSYVFENYIKEKNIQMRDNENYYLDSSPFEDSDGDDKKIKSMAYAMATKIYKEGFKPQPIFAVEIPQLIGDIKAVIPSFLTSMLKQQIDAKASDQLFATKKA
jgi:hypothetical protein